MREMFAQLFRMFTLAFSAGEKLAGTADNIGSYLEESSGAFKDQARIERQQKVARLMAEAPQIESVQPSKPRARRLKVAA